MAFNKFEKIGKDYNNFNGKEFIFHRLIHTSEYLLTVYCTLSSFEERIQRVLQAAREEKKNLLKLIFEFVPQADTAKNKKKFCEEIAAKYNYDASREFFQI